MSLLNAHQRMVVPRVALGCWLFAFFVGVGHACGLDGVAGPSQPPVSAAADTPGQADDDAGCGQFCAGNLPVLEKLQAVQDQPGGQPVLLSPFLGEPLLARITTAPSPLHRPHPPPGIPLNTRFVRLAL